MQPALPTVNPLVVLMGLTLMAAVVGSWIWAVLRIAFGAPVLPRFEPRVVPWGGKSVLAVLLMWLVLQVAGQFAFFYATRGTIGRPRGGPSPFTPSEMMVASAIQNTAVLIVIPLLLVGLSQARPRDLGLTRRQASRQVLQGMIAWPLTAPVVYGMMILAVVIWGKQNHPLETAILNDGVGRMSFIFFLAGAILAPAAEELIFRGVLLGWLTRLALLPRKSRPTTFEILDDQHLEPSPPLLDFAPGPTDRVAPGFDQPDEANDPYAPPRAALDPAGSDEFGGPAKAAPAPSWALTFRLAVANVAVSILFAALHYSVWPTPVPIFFLSLALGLLYQRTGSLLAPVALHMTFNGVSTVLMLLTLGSAPRTVPTTPPKTPIPVPAPLPKPTPPLVGPVAVGSDLAPGSKIRTKF